MGAGSRAKGHGAALWATLVAYATAGPWPLLRAATRFATAPLARLASLLPPEGVVVDVGCGQGHFLRYCHERGMRRLVGIEPSPQGARRARRLLPSSVLVVRGVAQRLPIARASAVVAADVLYLLEPSHQEAFIAQAAGALQPGGTLVIKTMEPSRRIRQALNRAQEWLAVKVLGITWGHQFCFRRSEEWARLCRQEGLEPTVLPLWRGYLHPHVAIVARKAPATQFRRE